jgi:hypothetical protein
MFHNPPLQPVTIPGTDIVLCGCDVCVTQRQEWSDKKPALIENLDARDGEDEES